jgi:hypothetical protein
LRQEVQRAAEQHDPAADGPPAGQPGNRLRGNRLEDRGGQILMAGTVVEERLEIGFGKDAAP